MLKVNELWETADTRPEEAGYVALKLLGHTSS